MGSGGMVHIWSLEVLMVRSNMSNAFVTCLQ
jgi:hypothetical protein